MAERFQARHKILRSPSLFPQSVFPRLQALQTPLPDPLAPPSQRYRRSGDVEVVVVLLNFTSVGNVAVFRMLSRFRRF